MTDDFSLATEEENGVDGGATNDFALVQNPDAGVPAGPRPVATAILSLATSPDNRTDSISALQEETLQRARDLLSTNQDFTERLRVANDQQRRTMRNMSTLRFSDSPITVETQRTVENNYRAIAAEKVEENARVSAETEAVRRIQNDLTSGNDVEAKVGWNLFNAGTANEVYQRDIVNNMLIAQYVEKLQSERQEESWGGTIYNFLTSLIPTNYNFSRSGVVPGSETSVLNFVAPGENIRNQGELMLSRYRDPKDLAAALAPGGELDVSIRSNATTLGGFSPGEAASIVSELSYVNDEDRLWSNIWGTVDVATIGVGSALSKVGSKARLLKPRLFSSVSIPSILKRAGARDAARSVVADALETSVNEGAEAATKRTGLSTVEIQRSLEPTAINPAASTPHDVPMGVDVATHLRAAESARLKLPEQVQVSRATNPEEILEAYQQVVRAEEKRLGQSVKDVRFMYEDVRTGARSEFRGQLPEQGNVVHYVEYTIGRKSGGGFATAKSAAAGAERRGLYGVTFDEVVETSERVVRNADTGHTTRAYHGTGADFKEFDFGKGGTATDGANTKGTMFFTSNPDVAWTYARNSAGVLNRARLEELGKIIRGDAPLPAGKTMDAIEDEMDNLLEGVLEDAGANIRPVDLNTGKFYESPDMAGRQYNGPESLAIVEHARKNGYDGVIFRNYDDDMFGGRSSDVYAVFKPESLKPAFNQEIVRDVSGQWFVKGRVNVKEQGFYTSPLNTPSNNFFSPLRSDARRLDRSAQAKAVAAGASSGQLQKSLNELVKNSLKGLSKEDKRGLDEIIRYGQNKSKWFSDREFEIAFERVAGEVPDPRVLQAYKDYRLFNDIEFLERNDEIYKNLVVRGNETVSFDVPGFQFEGSAVVDTAKRRPTERVFDVSTSRHLNTPDRILTDEAFGKMIDDGYILIKTNEVVTFPDGTVARNFMAKRQDVKRRALDRSQLGYKEGGHRMYTGRYFAKQATEGTQPDTLQKYLKNPNVFRTGNNPNRLRDWAGIMNRAIDDFNDGIFDAAHFDDLFDHPTLSFPSGDEFVELIEKGAIDKKNRIEIVGDRELPSAYTAAGDDVLRFVDEAETATTGYYRSTGQLYTSRRGEHLLDESGEFAETVDPWETLNTALSNVSRMTSFSNYKTGTLERFSKTYGRFLTTRDLENVTPNSLLDAAIRPDVKEPALVRRIKAEQAGIKRILNHETEWEKGTRMANRELAEWVLGDSRGGWRETAHDFVYWVKKNDPVRALRSMAFDVKLGLFNFSQVLLQTSTIIGATAIAGPTKGWKAMTSMVPLHAYVISGAKDNVLDVLAKRSWKMSGFDSEAEFKEFARFVNRTGFMNVDNTQLLINTYGPNRVFGAGGAIDAVREKGRSLFYMAEQFNRAVSARIAYDTLKEQGVAFGSSTFRERFIGIADDYSFNMTGESSAAFQHGLMSIPTQFWAYNVRMMDAMLGNGFSKEQRARLILSQLLFAGAGGVPVVDAVADYLKRQNPPELTDDGTVEKNIESIVGTLDRGVVDKALWELFGADVRFGERVGTGAFSTNLFKDLFGMSEYGEKSPIEALGGATFSISRDIGKTLSNVVRYAFAETGGEAGFDLTKDSLLKLASNISTFSNVNKAMLAYNYGIYKSNKGTVQAANLPPADAFWISLGLRPQEMDELGAMKAYVDDRKQMISEASGQIRNWRQEAFTNPDAYEENMEKVNAFVKLLPADVRLDVLKRSNRVTDESFYDYVAGKYRDERVKEDTSGE